MAGIFKGSEISAMAHLMRKIHGTGWNETVCLSGWECELLLSYIDELKGGHVHGSEKVQTAGSKSTDAGAEN